MRTADVPILIAAMNFLGHLLLSPDQPDVITGNFMADAVKGRDLSRFTPGIAQGIRLHRVIDSFTDTHPLTEVGRARLHPQCGKYAGVALDLFYDHVLASTWGQWHAEPLALFTQRIYTLLTAHAASMPERTQRMLPYMVHGDWLSSYAREEGLAQALAGLSRRAPGGERLAGAERVFAQHASMYIAECSDFLRDIQRHLDQ